MNFAHGKKVLGLGLFALALLFVLPTFAAAQISIGIRIGPPPPPRVVRVLPPEPGPEFVWIEGYWYPVGRRYRWHEGYWTLPPYPGARWVGPRYDEDEFFEGYWEGEHGRVKHDHRWDHYRERDYHDHDRDRDRDHDRDREHHDRGEDHDR